MERNKLSLVVKAVELLQAADLVKIFIGIWIKRFYGVFETYVEEFNPKRGNKTVLLKNLPT